MRCFPNSQQRWQCIFPLPGFKQVPKHKVRILNQPQERAGPCEGRPEQKLPKDTWSCRFPSSLDD